MKRDQLSLFAKPAPAAPPKPVAAICLVCLTRHGRCCYPITSRVWRDTRDLLLCSEPMQRRLMALERAGLGYGDDGPPYRRRAARWTGAWRAEW